MEAYNDKKIKLGIKGPIKNKQKFLIFSHSSLAQWVECLPMVQETWVQSQFTSYQRLWKWYLIPPCLTFSIIRYISRIKWSNPGKRVASSHTPRCSSYWKGSLLVILGYGRQLYYLYVIYLDQGESPWCSCKCIGLQLCSK